mmetsp:Transcript_153200/g.371912  ORF Transcript_153200/g.371912 Transcript_153200/m.371912 type:complete len:238 (+) Transcript_153200:603-1316(+)
MAACAVSPWLSCVSLLNVSTTLYSCGSLRFCMAIASGTTRRTAGSPYCSRCSVIRRVISVPRSSPIATSPSPRTAMLWCMYLFFLLVDSASLLSAPPAPPAAPSAALASPSPSASASGCSAQMCRSDCTCSTLPEPAYAHARIKMTANSLIGCSTAAIPSHMFSTSAPRPRKCSASPRHRWRASAWSSSTSFVSSSIRRSAMTEMVSSLAVPTHTRPSAYAAYATSSMFAVALVSAT